MISVTSRAWLSVYLIGVILCLSMVLLFESYSYQDLLAWYDLPSSAYQSDRYEKDFFPADAYEPRKCLLRAILMGVLLIGWIMFRKCSLSTMEKLIWSAPKWTEVGIFLLAGFVAFLVQWHQYPAYDEVFTSYYIFDGSPFHAWSYYMLPNNHSLFSLIGSSLSFGDSTVYVGRVISIFFFGLGSVAMYRTWREVGSTVISWTMLLCVLSYFPLIGMAGQSRGYALMWCISWWVFWFGNRYLDERRSGDLQRIGALHVLGFLTMPSYLYIYLAVAIWLIWTSQDKIDLWNQGRSIVFTHISSVGVTLAWMSPQIAFSGYESLVSNKYVSLGAQDLGDFIAAFLPIAQHYLFYAFFELPWAIGLFLWIVLASFYRRVKSGTKWVELGMIMILTCLGMILLMKKWPFHRNLIVHFSIFYMIGLWGLLALISRYGKSQIMVRSLSIFVLLTIFGYQISQFNTQKLNQQVYFDDSEQAYRLATSVNEAILRHGADSLGVYFSDQSFYPAYIWKREHGKTCISNGKLRIVTRTEKLTFVVENEEAVIDSLGHYYIFLQK